MDGIIFKKVTLKIYRANEYRPELVPPTKYIKLDLTGWSFGLATGAGAAGPAGVPPMLQQQPSFMGRPDRSTNGSGLIAPHPSWVLEDTMSSPPAFQSETLASLIQFTNIASMEPGSLVIVGFPYESNPPTKAPAATQRPQQRGVGTATAPTCLRKCLSAYPFGAIYNAELGLDLAVQPIVDVGDVLAGQSKGETKALLSTTVSELLLRGSVPFLIGGSRDQTYYSALVRNFVNFSSTCYVFISNPHSFPIAIAGPGRCCRRVCRRDERVRTGRQQDPGLPGVLLPQQPDVPRAPAKHRLFPSPQLQLLRPIRAVRRAGLAVQRRRREEHLRPRRTHLLAAQGPAHGRHRVGCHRSIHSRSAQS